MSDIVVNSPAVDWITLTTWSRTRYHYWQDSFSEIGDWLGQNDTKFEQYAGIKLTHTPGTIFIGAGSQSGVGHYLMYLSSRLAHMLYRDASKGIEDEDEDRTNCSRIDLQVTIARPKDYDSWSLATALRERGKLVSTMASRSKANPVELRTVYVGSRTSDKLVRIYEKEDKEGELFLRFEVQYGNDRRGGRAIQTWRALLRDDSVMGRVLLNEIQLLNSKRLSAWFANALMGFDPLKIRTSYSKSMSTLKWFESQVMPALDRYLRETGDMELTMKFYKILAGDNGDKD